MTIITFKFNTMKTYYLNNSGSRWINKENNIIRLISLKDNYNKLRKVEFYSSFGNFAAANLKYKNKRYSLLCQTTDKNNIPVYFVDYKEYYDNLKTIDNLINSF